ncbi:Mediator of RNA polymerase II transcription subunit 21 [Penicillium citrinum]|uniref:Mediator of RNA polymerase II transcription subunit 21 n=1 Tax=Penicillium citrinum TaxID=5077 RepID=A0A9W9TGW4_PENCI|nr:Mediator of RNA polymerase II transcription subunit 21 [Penicillium citrinum]KAJ5221015.1 Mediator of RNA polymerase II transcription subunit 21 [Penicillium citrinum]
MADILTQLQTCLDQLATQFYATLGYLSTYHDNSPAIPPPNSQHLQKQVVQVQPRHHLLHNPNNLEPPQEPQKFKIQINLQNQIPPRTFASRQRELARDLIIKEQQIEYLISVLPGIGTSEAEQEAKIRELEVQLREVEEKREAKALELKKLRGKLENVLGAVSVGIYGDKESQHDTVSA